MSRDGWDSEWRPCYLVLAFTLRGGSGGKNGKRGENRRKGGRRGEAGLEVENQYKRGGRRGREKAAEVKPITEEALAKTKHENEGIAR